MNEVFHNNRYRILNVSIPGGQNMPSHHATSDAFVIVLEGEALLILGDETIELHAGSQQAIPSGQQHILRVVADFKACIVMEAGAEIDFD